MISWGCLGLVNIYTATDVGIGRANNEDRFLVIDNDKFVVADGMGGYAAGEIASGIMIETADKMLSGKKYVNEEELSAVIKKANQAIIDAATDKSDYKGMGTTVTILCLSANKAVWANVGDSRAYRFNNNFLTQVTEDHSLVADLVKNGSLTKSDAMIHPQRNVLTRAVGADNEINVDTGTFDLKAGDVFLICSDGVTTVLDDDCITEILKKEKCDLASILIKEALAKGSRDNITAIVIDTRE